MARRTSKAVVLSRVLLCVALGVAGKDAVASPAAAPVEAISTQVDGTPVVVRQRGDGQSIWHETTDGYTILRGADGNWVYALPAAAAQQRALAGATAELRPSTLVVGRSDPAAAGIAPHLVPKAGALHAEDPHVHQSGAAKAVAGRNPIASATGTLPLLVILGYYDDALSAPNCTRCATTHPSVFQSTVFGANPSVADYFASVSHGALIVTPVADSHGSSDDGVVGWLRLGPKTPEGTVAATSAYKSNNIAGDAINAAMAYVDFTAYDRNGDGKLRSDELSILVVVAGYEGSYGRDASNRSLADDKTSPRLWAQSRSFAPSSSGVAIPVQRLNGKSVSIDTRGGGMTYSIVGELHGDHPATPGIMTHELGHSAFGLPDLYDISGDSNGVGSWSVMGYGSWGKRSGDLHPGDSPVLPDAWSRVALGWVTPVIPGVGETVTVAAAASTADTVYILPTARAGEYFLVENRQYEGYDAGLCYLLYCLDFGGLAVWHVDDNVGTPGLNNDNADAEHRRVDLVAAVGDAGIDDRSSYGRVANLYYEGNKTEANDATTPSTRRYDGTASGVIVAAVSYSAPVMTFRAGYAADADTTSVASTTLNVNRAAQQDASSGAAGGGGTFGPLLLMSLVIVGARRRR